MNVTVKIPKEEEDKYIEFMCDMHNYREMVEKKNSADMIPNPENPQQFVKRKTVEGVIDDFKRWKQKRVVIETNITVE